MVSHFSNIVSKILNIRNKNMGRFLMPMGCDIPTTTAVTDTQFRASMEIKLIQAYNSVPSSTSSTSRKKRAARIDPNILQLITITRINDGKLPSLLIYYIKTSNQYVSPSLVISNMNKLTTQQMSVYLGLPVTTVATYYDSTTQNPGVDQKLWIIGAIFGSLAGIVFLIWLLLFLYINRIKPKDEPLLGETCSESENNNHASISSKYQNEVAVFSKPKNPMDGDMNYGHIVSTKVDKEIMTENDLIDSDIEERSEKKLCSTISKDKKLKIVKDDQTKSADSPEEKSEKSKTKDKSKKHKKNDKKKTKKQKHTSDDVEEQIDNQKSGGLMESAIAESFSNPNNKDTLTKVDDIAKPKEHVQDSLQKRRSTLVEVKPSELSNYDLLDPVPFVDTYNALHIYPRQHEEIIILSDGWNELLQLEKNNNSENSTNDKSGSPTNKSNLNI